MIITEEDGVYRCQAYIDFKNEFVNVGEIRLCPEGFYRFWPKGDYPLVCNDCKKIFEKLRELNKPINKERNKG